MKSMVSFQIFARMRVMQRSHNIISEVKIIGYTTIGQENAVTDSNAAIPTIISPAVNEPYFDPLDPSYDPLDPLYSDGSQWYLDDSTTAVASLNITKIWDDYKDAGVTIAIIDDGVDYTHYDLAENSDPSLGSNLVSHQSSLGINDGRALDNQDRHGTTVAGVIAADDNGLGVVGIAPDSTIAGLRIGFGADHTTTQVYYAFLEAKNFDIVNSSWGYSGYFFDSFTDPEAFGYSINPFLYVNDAIVITPPERLAQGIMVLRIAR
jgi:subtilisin family serine protease